MKQIKNAAVSSSHELFSHSLLADLEKVMLLCILGIWLIVLIIWSCDAWVRRSSIYCHHQLETVPVLPVALVLGCSPKVADLPNSFYTHRMASAVAFYQAGKVKAFIVSGDNATHQYDEAVSTVSNRKVLMPKTSLVNLLPLLIPENSWLVFKL